MSEEKEQAAEAVADAFISICGCVILNDLTITDIANELKSHPFVIDKTNEELEQVNFNLVVKILNCAVFITKEERINEPDRR